ncbi:prepilin-type N-terminal cleavage/methylation domain-containing protein [Kineococcus sp. NPDC059986]|uniref:prepilin-type N-terminal cleavage/methylation domain-containing protein n=1 Tax=Kineococcus sp. NPDC059986 TaxID=3155538 RepID=UPI00344C2DF7
MRNRCWTRRDDEGFTLIEVIVALTLLAIVASGALVFFLRGVNGASQMQRKQAAVELASAAMDAAQAVDPARLAIGRSKSEVDAQWAAWTGPDKSITLPTYDPAYPGPAPVIAANVDPTTVRPLPFSQTVRVSGSTYTVTTVVGQCYRSTTVLANGPCNRGPLGGLAYNVGPVVGYVPLYRVAVEVAWSGVGQGSGCANGACRYRTTALIDPTDDQQWSVTPAPVTSPSRQPLNAQVTSPSTGTALRILEDAGNTDTFSRVVVTSVVTGTGRFLVDGVPYSSTNTTGRTLGFAVPANTVGTFSARYFIRNADGQASRTVTLSVPVLPVASADTWSGTPNRSGQTRNLLQNDVPNAPGPSIQVTDLNLTTGSCSGTLDASSGVLTYTTPSRPSGGGGGSCTWSYVLRGVGDDSTLASSGTATVNF